MGLKSLAKGRMDAGIGRRARSLLDRRRPLVLFRFVSVVVDL